MKFIEQFLGVAFLAVCLAAMSGCATSPSANGPQFHPTSGAGKSRIALKVEILNDSESWFGKAELYLKVVSTATPDFYWLWPLNVQNATTGARTYQKATPFVYETHMQGRLTLELLDDDSLSKEEEHLIVSSSRFGGNVIGDGINLYAISNGVGVPLSPERKKEFSDLFGDAAKVIIQNVGQHAFESYGSFDYAVNNTTIDVNRANPITIIDPSGTVRCKVWLWLVPVD